ncbi:SMC-Scp complex subunit ScpB [Actinoplanes sp. NEAU-A12]|uniref:SMC-Scp complex subunit ScpB n=1 Tax=Actinoplanes sandaracinus TaxID=3045177 RepID=A0ABT6WXK9_9ACTN|nr:SMC-Scp complex subunit ScpB [Actinoplanes sandaracinus]MDI6104434.1 SMC-Scp complex subunit ScpB [Actinoplanes sandaracinus]
MSSEERPESLAAQAAAWVPPWDRRREPDREFQASAEDSEPPVEESEPLVEEPESPVEEPESAVEPPEAPVEEAEPAPVDAPVEPPVEVAPTEVEPEPEPEITLPEPVEEAMETEPGPAPASDARTTVPSQPRRPRDSVAAVVESVTRTPAPVLMDDAELAAALESIMLVVDEPVGELQLAQVLEQPAERVARALEDVSARYTAAGHGIDLRRVAGGWRLYTRPEYAAYVERFVLDGQSVRLTQAALETLAVVAYKQPVTRSRISAIRGVNCDGVMRTLVTRGLIEECGTEPETGAYLYRTTPLFLEKLGLNTVDQLPPLAPFLPDDVEEVLDASG